MQLHQLLLEFSFMDYFKQPQELPFQPHLLIFFFKQLLQLLLQQHSTNIPSQLLIVTYSF